MKSSKENCMEFATKSDQLMLWKPSRKHPIASALTFPNTTDQAAVLSMKPNQSVDRLSSERQTGRRAILFRNIKAIANVLTRNAPDQLRRPEIKPKRPQAYKEPHPIACNCQNEGKRGVFSRAIDSILARERQCRSAVWRSKCLTRRIFRRFEDKVNSTSPV